MAYGVIVSTSTRLKLGLFLLVLGFALAGLASLWGEMSFYLQTKALAITASVCLTVAVTAAGVGVFLEEARGHVIPKVLAAIFGILGCIFFIAAASLKIDWHHKYYRERSRGFYDTNSVFHETYQLGWSDFDYACALMILGAIFALIGAIFCLFALSMLGLRKSDSEVRTGEVRVHTMKDTDGDGRVDKVETKKYTVND